MSMPPQEPLAASPPSVGETPLLVLDDARIDRRGVAAADGWTCVAAGRRVALTGRWQPLVELMVGTARLVRGRAEIGGENAREAVLSGRVGVGASSLALPSEWTFAEYLVQSALLLGLGRGTARAAAQDVLERLFLHPLGARPIRGLTLAERRMLTVAHACLGAPEILFLEEPLARLDDRSQHFVADLVLRGMGSLPAVIVFESPAATGAERALLESTEVVLHASATGMISEAEAPLGTRWRVTVAAEAEAFLTQLGARGGRVEHLEERRDADGHAATIVFSAPGELDSASLLQLSLETRSPLIELLPLEGASLAAHPSA